VNAYDYIDLFAVAVRDNAAVLTFCTTNFSSGLLVQVDDDQEDPITSGKAPYCLIHCATGSDNSPVADESDIRIRVEVGTVAGNPPYLSDTTTRTATANGLRKYGAGNKTVDLLDLCMVAIKAVNIGENIILKQSSVEADGILFFPLQVASSVISIGEQKDLSAFN
jgi:hypothetical protein